MRLPAMPDTISYMNSTEQTYRKMSYTLELSDDEGKHLVAALKRNNVYGDAAALEVIQEAVVDGRLTMEPVAFRSDASQPYREVVTIPELSA